MFFSKTNCLIKNRIGTLSQFFCKELLLLRFVIATEESENEFWLFSFYWKVVFVVSPR